MAIGDDIRDRFQDNLHRVKIMIESYDRAQAKAKDAVPSGRPTC